MNVGCPAESSEARVAPCPLTPFVQLTKALKARVIPPAPNLLLPSGRVGPPAHSPGAGTAGSGGGGGGGVDASPSGLPPWDNIRYVWRGGLKVDG